MSSGAVSSELSAGELRARFLGGQEPGRHFILIDLRGSDFEGGTIKGSSCGRGPKGATLFSDHIITRGIPSKFEGEGKIPRGLVLVGGVNGWAKSGQEYTDLMDGYDSGHWASH